MAKRSAQKVRGDSSGNDENKRFSMWLRKHKFEELEALCQVTGKETVAEVIREAISVYTSLVTANRKGRVQLFYKDPKSNMQGPLWLLPGLPPFDAD